MENSNTKLNLFYCNYECYSKEIILSRALRIIGEIRKTCGYTFKIPMPVDLIVDRTFTKKEVPKFFSKGTKIVEDNVLYGYYLVFDCVLTEEQTNMWRMFKMGWRSARWNKFD
jgi:hypothetical protein